MKINCSNALSSLAALIGVGTLALACSQVPTTSTDESNVGSDEAALTAAQCDYFDINGTIQICHALGNGKFKILKLNEQACINAHGNHATDYVTSTNPSSPLYDPTCKGNGCLPLAAPCDATLPCCDGSTCTNGTCVADGPTCPCPFDAPDFSSLSCAPSQGGWELSGGTVLIATENNGNAPGYGTCTGSDGIYASVPPAVAQVCIAALLAFDAAHDGLCTGSGKDLCTDVPSPLPPIQCAVATCHADLGGFWDYQATPAGTTCNTTAGAAGTCDGGGTCVANAVNPCPCGGDPAWESVLNSGWACSQAGSEASVSNDGNTYGWSQGTVCGAISTDETQSVEITDLTPAQIDACTAQLCHL